MNLLKLPSKPSECHWASGKKDVCSDEEFIKTYMIDFLKSLDPKAVKPSDLKKNIKPKDIIKKVGEKIGCDKESCILRHKNFQAHVGHHAVIEQLKKNLKPIGPANTNDWLSDSNIDKTLEQWKEKFPGFLHIYFQMRDFQITKTSLATIDLAREYERGMRQFGVAINTDYSTGPGIHWFAIFGDFTRAGTPNDPFTLEYFNSSGNPPLNEIAIWMKKTKHELRKNLNKSTEDIIVTRMEHQQSDTECGVYTLFYIFARLNGVPHTYFKRNRIPDEDMYELRKHLFIPEK